MRMHGKMKAIAKTNLKFYGMARPLGRDWKAIMAKVELFLQTQQKATIRQIFYHLVAQGLVRKDENDYDFVGRKVNELRRKGLYVDSIVDETRSPTGGDYGNSDVDSYVESQIESIDSPYQFNFYRRYWESQDKDIEVWVEKNALASIVEEVTSKYRVRCLACKGYTTDSLVIELYRRVKKDTIILYLTDHDPSGLNMETSLKQKIREYSFLGGADITVERIGLTQAQVSKYGKTSLSNPVNPNDPRSKGYQGTDIWELDVLEPSELKEVVKEAIESHLDMVEWEANKKREKDEGNMVYEFSNQVAKKFSKLSEELKEDWKRFKEERERERDEMDGES